MRSRSGSTTHGGSPTRRRTRARRTASSSMAVGAACGARADCRVRHALYGQHPRQSRHRDLAQDRWTTGRDDRSRHSRSCRQRLSAIAAGALVPTEHRVPDAAGELTTSRRRGRDVRLEGQWQDRHQRRPSINTCSVSARSPSFPIPIPVGDGGAATPPGPDGLEQELRPVAT